MLDLFCDVEFMVPPCLKSGLIFSTRSIAADLTDRRRRISIGCGDHHAQALDAHRLRQIMDPSPRPVALDPRYLAPETVTGIDLEGIVLRDLPRNREALLDV